MFKLIGDSTSDLPKEFFEEHNVDCIHFTYEIDGKEYGHGEELDPKEFYAMMRGGKMPTTSQVTPERARKHFEKAVAEGYKEILCLAFSSGLSGSYGNMCLAAKDMMEDNPGVKIEVIDTLAASMGEGLVVYKAVKLMEAGKSMDETAGWLREHIQNFVHVFTVDDLFHLHRGGRVSKATAFVGTLAGIKPKLHVDSEGHLSVIGKDRGRKKSLIALVDYMGQKMGDFRAENEDMIMIGHGDCLEDALFVKNLVEERYGYHNFMVNTISPTIGAHSGPGTMTLFFMGESR